MPSLVSEADIAVPDPAGFARTLIEFWTKHDVAFEQRDGRMVAELGIGSGALLATEKTLNVRVEAADLGALETLRSVVVSTVIDFAEVEPRIVWRGHTAGGATFANFREVRVVSNVALGPRMRRLTFTGGDVARFGSADDIHIRLHFPPEGIAVPQWPRPGSDGRTIWPPEAERPEVRYYTVRSFDRSSNEIVVDFVIHDDAGPGSSFANRAAPGAICGMAGPVGRAVRPAAWTLLAGDETALPAIARTLEEMPTGAKGAAFIEVGEPAEALALRKPDGVSLEWLVRGGEPAGTTTLLQDAIAATDWPEGEDVFVWVACEYGTSQIVRRHLRAVRKLPRDRHMVVGYWHRDHDD